MESVQTAIQQTLSLVYARNSFIIEDLATSSHVSWSLWITLMTICGPLASDAHNCFPQPHTICHYSGNCWSHKCSDFLETESLTGPEPTTLHTQMSIMSWFIEEAPCKLGTTIVASFPR